MSDTPKVADPRVDALMALLDRHRGAVRDAFQRASEAWHEVRPAEDAWSVAEVLEHLVATEQAVTRLLRPHLPALEARGPGDFDPAAFSEEVDMPFFLDRSRKIRGSQPPGVLGAGEAWRALATSRRDLLDLLDDARGRRLDALFRPHPASGEPLNGYQWIAFVALHEGRHAAQIEAIVASLEHRDHGWSRQPPAR